MKLLNYPSHCTIYCAYNHINWLTKFAYHDLNIPRKTMKWVKNNSWTTMWHFFLCHFVTRLSMICNVMWDHECRMWSIHGRNTSSIVYLVVLYTQRTQKWHHRILKSEIGIYIGISSFALNAVTTVSKLCWIRQAQMNENGFLSC